MGNAGARLGVQLGFALAGAAIGGGSPVGFAIGGLVGGIVGSLLFPMESENTTVQGPRLGDLSVQTSTYGNAIPILYGTVRVAGNVIWSTGLIEHVNTITQDVSSGKGGSSPTSTVTTYTYTVSFAVSLCNNEIIGIKRIWADDKLWYDFSNPPVGVSFSYELYTGTETQLPCSAIEADKGAGNVPAFRGQAYIVFKDLDLTKFGNRVPNFHFEVVCRGTQSLTPQFYTDTMGAAGFFTRTEIDTETGLVWYTRGQQNAVYVVTPDLVLVKAILNQISVPHFISFQPAYMYLDMPDFGPAGLGQEPTVREMEPRMWVSSNVWGLLAIGGAAAAEIDTRDYEVRLNNNITGSTPPGFQPWLGVVEVDMRTIHVEDINSEGTQYVHFCNANQYSLCWSWSITKPNSGAFGNYRENPEFNAQRHFNVSDFVANDSTMAYAYVMWGDGTIWACDEHMVPIFIAQPIIDFANVMDRLVWDKFERKLYAIVGQYASGTTYLIKFSEDLQTIHWQISRPNIQAFTTFDIHPQTGALYVMSYSFGSTWRLHEIDKADGSYLTDYEVLNTAGRIWFDMKIYPNSMFAMVSYVAGGSGSTGSGIARVPLTPAPTGDPPTLQMVVEDITTRTGLVLADLNASALASDFVSGYALAQVMPARSAIEPLMRGYFFDAVESDFIAKFVKRGGSSIKTISYLDSGAIEPGSTTPPPQRDRSRMEENEMPWQVNINYLDVASFYKTNVQYARRLIGQSKTLVTAEISVVFTSTQAKRIAEVLLYNAWTERQTAGVKLTKKYLDLDPSDIVTFASAPNLSLLDNFDRPSQTPPSHWPTVEGAGLKIVGGVLVPVNVAAECASIYSERFYPDIEIEVTVGWMDKDTVAGWGISFRHQSRTVSDWQTPFDNDHYELRIGNWTDGGVIKGFMKLYKYYDSTFTSITSITSLAAFKYGDRARIGAHGTKFIAYQNDVRTLLAIDATIPAGDYIGLISWQDNSEIREIRVGPYVVPTTQDYRITRAEYTAPNLMELTLVEEDTSVYTATGTGIDNEVPSQSTPALVPTIVFFMDTSIMGREADNDIGYYFAGTPSFGSTWPGAGLYRSDDSGTSYVAVTDFPSAVTAGVANSVLSYEGSIP